ncbi:MAG: hypothetical protein ACK55Z_18935, partial [bacterium]
MKTEKLLKKTDYKKEPEVFTNTLIQLKYLDQIQYQLTIFKNPADLIKILITPRNLLDNKNLISSNRKYLILGKKD